MPLQNRVTPSGEIVATPERGTMMGNRGLLHNHEGRVVRSWRGRRWIICLLQFRGRQRQVMSPGLYTELFFLDEATALAAGHRPCAECRRELFNEFRDAWLKGNGGAAAGTAGDIDRRLHEERLGPGGMKRTFQAVLDELPDGVFVRLPGDERVWLLWNEQLLAWSPGGYGERGRRPRSIEVSVLTPPSAVAAIRAGYGVEVHESAGWRGTLRTTSRRPAP